MKKRKKFTCRMSKIVCLICVLILIFNIASLGAFAAIDTGILANLPSSRYFIHNIGTDVYIEYDAASTNAQLDVYTGAFCQKWELIPQTDGTYLIQNVDNELYLTANLSPAVNTLVTFERKGTNTLSLKRQKWVIKDMGNGEYTIQAKANQESGNNLVIGKVLGSMALRQREYVNDTDKNDLWRLYQIGDEVGMLGIYDPGHDHGSCFHPVMQSLYQTQYNTFNTNYQITTDPTSVKLLLNGSDIFVSRSHGGYTTDGTCLLLSVKSAPEESKQYLYSYEIHYNGATFVNLNNVKLAMFVACETAYDSNYSAATPSSLNGLTNVQDVTNSTLKNLVTASYHAGADVVIGFKTSIWCSDANIFTEKFFQQLKLGKTISESAYSAASASGDARLYLYSIAGNSSLTLNTL